jgi:4-amino-4-deoxy-L-arabinose transferase-like glycosyltransferase
MTASVDTRRDLLILLLAFLLVAAVRIAAPSDLATGDQPYQVDYIRDIVHHDAWIAQHLANGAAATKPPLYNWLAATAVLATGSESDPVLKLPSLVAGLLTLLFIWDLGRRTGGPETAFYSGLFLICSTMFSKQIYFARTDMLLTMLVVAQIWAALRHEERPGRMHVVLYWVAASLAMLTKGPVGVVIPLAGLSFWWWRRGVLRDRWREMHVPLGLVVATAVFAGWFLAAVAREPAVFDQLVYAETLDRFKASSSKSKENRHVFYYIPHFLGRMAPASIFAVIASIQLLRKRRDNEPVGAALWWLLVTFVMLSLVPSKRADRLFPLFPATALLAGWTVAHSASARTALRWSGVVLLIAGLAAAVSPAFQADSSPLIAVGGLIISTASAGLIWMSLRRSLRASMLALSATMFMAITLYQFTLRN